MEQLGAYRDSLSVGNKLLRGAWRLFAFLFFRPFAGPLFRYWRSFVLRTWGARVGKRCSVAAGAKIWAPWNIEMGDYVAIANDAELYDVAKIRIGHYVTVSQSAYICTASHDISKKLKQLTFKDITIGDFSWVCAKAMVLPGVTIGEGAVVAAGSVVSRDVGSWTVVGGNPAREIKKRILQ